MLTFLRKIRKSLIESLPSRQAGGSTQKYLLYTMGEIALVVIGILIALQINNWNEHRSLQKKVDTQLVNLSLLLEDNIRMLRFHVDANERRFFTWQHILKYAGKDTVALSLDSWNEEKFAWSGPIPTDKNYDFIHAGIIDISWAFLPPPWQTEALNEMKSTGLFSEISNEELKLSINRFYFLLELWMGTSEMDAYQLSQELTKLLRNQKSISVFDPSNAEEILAAVANDEQIEVMLFDLTHYAHSHFNHMARLLEMAEKLVADISLETIK